MLHPLLLDSSGYTRKRVFPMLSFKLFTQSSYPQYSMYLKSKYKRLDVIFTRNEKWSEMCCVVTSVVVLLFSFVFVSIFFNHISWGTIISIIKSFDQRKRIPVTGPY
jgi:hypothetical protein